MQERDNCNNQRRFDTDPSEVSDNYISLHIVGILVYFALSKRYSTCTTEAYTLDLKTCNLSHIYSVNILTYAHLRQGNWVPP